MNVNKKTKIVRAMVVASLAGCLVYAQQEKIQDQDLLNLLDTVNEASTAVEVADVVVDTPVSPAQEIVEVSEERTTITDAIEVTEESVTTTDATAVSEVTSAPTNTPISRAQEIIEVSEERETLTDAVMSEEVSTEAGIIMDELQIAVVDESIASSVGTLISVRLSRVSLEEAINLFAQLSGANIIVPELTEAAQISVNLKDVEWRPALQSILDTYNYELYQRVSGSNVFSVRRRPPGAPEPQVVETFTLKYATIGSAAALVRELLPENAKVSEFASRNMMVVKSSESSLSEIRAVLEAIDKVRQQVFIESKFMELSDDAQKDLGIDWSVLQSYGASAGGLNSTVTDTDSKSTMTSRLFDMNGDQFQGEDAPVFIDDGTGNFVPYQSIIPSVQRETTKALSQVSTAVLSADDFRLVLGALEQNKGVNVVSNPKVIVANEELANISIIRKEPNLKQERQQTAGAQGGAAIDNIVFSLDEEMPFFEYGIKLDVLPSINTSSNITVQIEPSLTRKFADKQAGEVTYPIIDEKRIKTVFNLASGQTAAIGGLTEITEGEEEKKVPVLGSIPFLGRLFSWKRNVRGQSETIIFVTVGLANTEDINDETGMPGDAELARRQIIRDNNKRILRDSGRQYYQAEEDDKLQDMMKVMKQKEDVRVERRQEKIEQQ